MIAGKDAPGFGEAKNAWLTGTAAWSFVSISQAILGVIPTLDGLLLDPCVPGDWKEFTVTRHFRGADYRIHIRNPQGVQKGIVSVTADGKPLPAPLLPIAPSGSVLQVEAVMG